jgi:hypothetical protein
MAHGKSARSVPPPQERHRRGQSWFGLSPVYNGVALVAGCQPLASATSPCSCPHFNQVPAAVFIDAFGPAGSSPVTALSAPNQCSGCRCTRHRQASRGAKPQSWIWRSWRRRNSSPLSDELQPFLPLMAASADQFEPGDSEDKLRGQVSLRFPEPSRVVSRSRRSRPAVPRDTRHQAPRRRGRTMVDGVAPV